MVMDDEAQDNAGQKISVVEVTGNDYIKNGLTPLQACSYLGGISRPTLYKLMREGAVKSYTIASRRYVLRAELDRFIDEQIKKGAVYKDTVPKTRPKTPPLVSAPSWWERITTKGVRDKQ